jgi:hypothetical protein
VLFVERKCRLLVKPALELADGDEPTSAPPNYAELRKDVFI